MEKIFVVNNKNMTLYWVLGYCFITGNEKADKLTLEKMKIIRTYIKDFL